MSIGSNAVIRELEKEVEIYSHIATKENLLKSVGHLGKGSQPELRLWGPTEKNYDQKRSPHPQCEAPGE